MKKEIIASLFTLLSVSAMADDVAGMVVTKTDGSKVNVAIADIRSIKFTDGNMFINNKDNSQQIVAMDDVTVISFGDIPSAIKAIVGTDNKQMTITDLSGRVVYKGMSQSDDVPASLHGIYIITVDGQSHKIAVK